MDRCPNCRASCAGGETCRRCGMELGTLLAVEAAAERLIRHGLARLAQDDPAAIAALVRARRLRREAFLDLLIAFADARTHAEVITDDLAPPMHPPASGPATTSTSG